MRAVQYDEFGGPDVLQLVETEPLAPATDEVRLDVEAVGVNPCDALRRQGLWDDSLPLIPGSDVAGTVVEAGEHVQRFDAGDRVFGTIPHLNVSGERGDRQGTYAESVVARADRLATLPDGVAFAVGAGVGLVGITAWRALVHFGELRPGDTCLIHGGSGGVGHVAVQLAREMGATVVATASPERTETVRELGAAAVVDYGGDDLRERIEATDTAPPDVVLDHRAGEYLQLDIDVLAAGGDIVIIGGNYDTPRIDDLTAAIGKDATIQPMDMFNEPDIAGVLSQLSPLLERGALSVEVARTYDLTEAAEAHEAVMNDSFVGKLVIEP